MQSKLQIGVSLFFFLLSLSPALAFAVCGVITDENTFPINNAIVRIQNTKTHSFSDENGRFCLESATASEYTVTAWASGYYIGGTTTDASPNHIRLKRIPTTDHEDYQWKASTHTQIPKHNSATEPCQQCHSQLTNEWIKDAHGSSNNNALFQQLFAGQTLKHEEINLPGFKKDFPAGKNSCKLCHQPAAKHLAIECDYCHKIQSVDTFPSLLLGHERIQFIRPKKQELFFGSLDDVYLRDDTFHPLYQSSDYCASCHQGRFWNTDVYSDYAEWLNSPYQSQGIQCQDCHMKNQSRVFSANKEKGGITRYKESLSNHNFHINEQTLKDAIELNVVVQRDNSNQILLNVTLINTGAGHKFPGGSPLRHLLMRVDIRDANNNLLKQISGSVLPQWLTRHEKALTNKPGIVFAKLLKDVNGYSSKRQHKKNFVPMFPAPFWRPTLLHKDNRIPAKGKIETQFIFEATQFPINVNVKLYYRNIFKHWLKVRDKKFKQTLLAEYSKKETINNE